MKKIAIIIIFLINLTFSIPGECSTIEEYWLKTVVLIEQEIKNVKGESQIMPIGTGFLLQSEKGYFYIVTCKHVVKNKDDSNRAGLFYKLNTKSSIKEPFDRIPIDSIFKETGGDYFSPPNKNVDMVIFPIGVNIQRDDVQFIRLNRFEEFDKINLGEDLFVLGYPSGMIAAERNVPVVRDGIVSFKNSDFTCFVDIAVFPGDSGSPVITKSFPYTYNRETFNLKEIKSPQLIGMISQQIRYTEPAISPQTGNVRVTFEENSGLSMVISANFIKDILKSDPLKHYEEEQSKKQK